MKTKDLWTNPATPLHFGRVITVEVVRTNTLGGGTRGDPARCKNVAFQVRGASFGHNFLTRADAHAALIKAGYVKVTT